MATLLEMKHHADSLLISMVWSTTNQQVSPELRQLFLMSSYHEMDTYLMSLYCSRTVCPQLYGTGIMSGYSCLEIQSINPVRTSQKWGLHMSNNKNKGLSIYTHIPTVLKLWLNMLNPPTKKEGKHLTSTLRSTTQS